MQLSLSLASVPFAAHPRLGTEARSVGRLRLRGGAAETQQDAVRSGGDVHEICRSIHRTIPACTGLALKPAGGAEDPAGTRRFAVVEHFLNLD